MKKQEFSMEIGGKTLSAEFNDIADQTNGSVLLRYGDTAVFATVVMSKERKEGMNYFPLVVDYEEKFYAAGAILGSRYMRREGRPSDGAILSARVIDRAIRPLFDQTIRNEVQVVITVLSLGEDDPDVVAANAASLAIATSDIPWGGPVSSVRVGMLNGEIIINPSYNERDTAELEIIVSGKDGNVNMIEAGADELGNDVVGDALDRAVKELEQLQSFQKNIIEAIGKEKKIMADKDAFWDAGDLFAKEVLPKIEGSVMSGEEGKESIHLLEKEWMNLYEAQFSKEPDNGESGDGQSSATRKKDISYAGRLYNDAVNDVLHNQAVKYGKRADGRDMNMVRNLYAQAGGVSSLLHGTGIFYRGGTHVLSALTLGGPRDALLLDNMETQGEKRFMHHYNFPPFSAGETGRIGGTNRRMIGHGALAERALAYVIPNKDKFPYTIRIVSESMASNGSTSMASVCAGTLALMDAGVPIKRPVAGIAMGLMMTENGHRILTDIQGPEDEHGDMDFKVAGTEKGITAIQLDIKVDGIPVSILREALIDAEAARLKILDAITSVIAEPRADISPVAPKIIMMSVQESQIGLVIGPGGKTINGIKDDTGVEDIQIEDDGTVYITGKNGTAEKAKQIIYDMTRKYSVGERLVGTVTELFDFGALVKINSFTEGLVHISELAPFRIANVSDVVSVGDEIPVVVKEVGERGVKFSLKDADKDYAKNKGVTAAPFQQRPHSGTSGR